MTFCVPESLPLQGPEPLSSMWGSQQGGISWKWSGQLTQPHTCQAAHGGDTLAVEGHRQQCFPGVLGKSWEHFSSERKSVNGFTVRLPVLNGRLVWKMWMQRCFLIQHKEKRVAMHNCIPEKKNEEKKERMH